MTDAERVQTFDGPTYLIVDDDQIRAENRYRKLGAFRNEHSDRYPIHLELAYTPRRAISRLKTLSEIGQPIGGVLADCDLNASRPVAEHREKQATVVDSIDNPYLISTGMGVLDWVERHLRGTATWAIVDTTAPHSPLYASAAHLWFESKPMDINRFGDANGLAGILAELLSPPTSAAYDELSRAVSLTTTYFDDLMDQTLQGVEPLDWLAAMVTLPRRYRRNGNLTNLLEQRIKEIVGRPVPVQLNRLCFLIARSQALLEKMYRVSAFPVSDEIMQWDEWPKLDEDALRRDTTKQNVQHWADFNPITEVFGDQTEVVRFLTAPDVRVALRHYRERTPRHGRRDR